VRTYQNQLCVFAYTCKPVPTRPDGRIKCDAGDESRMTLASRDKPGFSGRIDGNQIVLTSYCYEARVGGPRDLQVQHTHMVGKMGLTI
jgi:hypothetical protein